MSEEDPKDPQDPGQDPPGNGDKPKPVPYERFKEVNEAKTKLESEKGTLEKQLTDLQAKLKAKEDEGKSEVEKLTEQFNTLQTELARERNQRQRLEIATRTGIPADLAPRLSGNTPEELEEDAKRLKEYLKPAEGPGNPPTNPRSGRPAGAFDFEGKTPEEIRKAVADGKVKLQ